MHSLAIALCAFSMVASAQGRELQRRIEAGRRRVADARGRGFRTTATTYRPPWTDALQGRERASQNIT